MVEVNWPNDKKFVVCLTHDVDRVKKTYQCLTHFFKEKRLYHLVSLFTRPNPYWTFEGIMKLEDDYNVRSTFFFLNETMKFKIHHPEMYKLSLGRYDIESPKIADVIRKLDAHGWEIGVHGSYNSYQNQELLKSEKRTLERIIGKEIIGIRQHYLNLEIPTTWQLQRTAGFKYDASFGYREQVGFRSNKMIPFRPFNDNFYVIPLTIMDGALFARYKDRSEAWSKCKEIIQFASKTNAVITVLWHTDRFNTKEWPGQMEIYDNIIRLSLEKGAWITPCRDLWRFLVNDQELSV